MKHKKILKFIFYSTLIIFLFLYTIEETGYYEYKLNTKKNLTEKEIKQFESDVREGKEIDLNNYLKDNYIDYSNNLTRATSKISLELNEYIKKILTDYFNILQKLIK